MIPSSHSSRSTRRLLLGAALALAAGAGTGACGEKDPELRGELDRVIGETVTVALIEAGEPFSGGLDLVAADGVKFATDTLHVQKASDHEISIVVPVDAAAGEASLRLARTDNGPLYLVPLHVNRLAVWLDSVGDLGFQPLPPTTLSASTEKPAVAAANVSLLSISPTGGLLAILFGDQLRLVSLKKAPADLGTPTKILGASCLAAMGDGALLCVGNTVEAYRYDSSKGVTRLTPYTVSGTTSTQAVKAISVDDTGTRAALVGPCTVSGVDGDCLTVISIGSSLSEVRQIPLGDTAGSASSVSLGYKGNGIVAANGFAVFGVALTGVKAGRVQRIALPAQAKVIGVEHGYAESLKTDVFAVADSGNKAIRLYGFDQGVFKPILRGETELVVKPAQTPSRIAFGRRTDLYYLSGKNLYLVKNLQYGYTESSVLTLSTTGTISQLVIQP
jgi:hypothetical protein